MGVFCRLRVVSSFPPRRSSRINRREMRELARENWGEDKKSEKEGGGGGREGKVETTDTPLLKNLRGRWRQYSDWPVLLFHQKVSRHDGRLEFLDCYDGLQFRERF